MDSLPAEILRHIVSFITDQKSLAVLRLVNRKFRDVAGEKLFYSLEFDERCVFEEVIALFSSSNAGRSVREIIVRESRTWRYWPFILDALYGKNYERSNECRLKKVHFEYVTRSSERLLIAISNLNLTCLEITGSILPYDDYFDFVYFLKRCSKSVETLIVNEFHDVTDDFSLVARDLLAGPNVVPKNQKLTTIKFNDCSFVDERFLALILTGLLLPKLRRVCVDDASNVIWQSLKGMLPVPPNASDKEIISWLLESRSKKLFYDVVLEPLEVSLEEGLDWEDVSTTDESDDESV